MGGWCMKRMGELNESSELIQLNGLIKLRNCFRWPHGLTRAGVAAAVSRRRSDSRCTIAPSAVGGYLLKQLPVYKACIGYISAMKDLTNPNWIKFKGILFLVVGLISSVLLIFEHPSLKVVLLLAV